MDYAEIKITSHSTETLPNRYVITHTYEWVGPRHLPARICDADRHVPRMPWKMVLVEERFEMKGGLYIRADAGVLGIGYWARCQLERHGRILKTRIIYTAAVWGLARVSNGCYPIWHDVHAIRWIAERVGRWTR